MIFRKFLSTSALLISLILGAGFPAGAQVDFPIGYVSRGETYAFISLIEKHKLLEQEGINPLSPRSLPTVCREKASNETRST
jgi:hypothetical protein